MILLDHPIRSATETICQPNRIRPITVFALSPTGHLQNRAIHSKLFGATAAPTVHWPGEADATRRRKSAL
jgi:hypothetical protein